MSKLEETLKNIKKRFGAESIMTSKDYKELKIDVISTGLISLDIALGRGGIPKGRISEIFGKESSGKSTLSLMIIAEAQKQNEAVALIDAEMAFDPEYARSLGVDTEKLIISQPKNGEEGLEIVEELVRSKNLGVIVVDSVSALVPKKEIEGEMGDAQMGLQARLMSQAMRKLTGITSKANTAIIFINQIRMKLGNAWGSPETTSGGLALKFYSSLRLELKRGKQLIKDNKHVGNVIHFRVIKNKIAPPYKTCDLEMYDDEVGFNIASDLFLSATQFGLIHKTGNTWFLNEKKLGVGISNAMQNINRVELKKLIIDKWKANNKISNVKINN